MGWECRPGRGESRRRPGIAVRDFWLPVRAQSPLRRLEGARSRRRASKPRSRAFGASRRSWADAGGVIRRPAPISAPAGAVVEAGEGGSEAVEEAEEHERLLVREVGERGVVVGADLDQHLRPGRVALRREADAPDAAVLGAARALDEPRALEAIEDGGEVLPGEHEEGDELLHRHAALGDRGARQGAQDRPLLRRRAVGSDRARARLVHQIRRLIEAEEEPVRDVEPRFVRRFAGEGGWELCH